MTADGKLLINGEWIAGKGDTMTSHSPWSDALLWSGQSATETQTDDAVTAAAAAGKAWSARTFEDRLRIVEAFSAIAKERQEEMAGLITNEMGKALWDARTEAAAIAGKAALSVKAYHERTPTKEEAGRRLTHRPHGVMVVIGPFNFPGHLPNGHIIPALLAGNTIVFKPSEETPAVGALMAEWWKEAGLPNGVLNLIHGGADVARRAIGHQATDGVLFTGGVEAGLAIHRALAGQPEKILALELGGNNPIVAWDVADADAAARIIVRSAFITTGQRCTCARRLIVPAGSNGQRIIDALNNLLPRLHVDRPDADPQPFMGSLIHGRAAASVLRAQSSIAAAGGEPLVPVIQHERGEAFLTPGLLDTTNWQDRQDEEVFGPLLQVIRAQDFDEAIHISNDTRFGLAAGLLSDDRAKWDQFAAAIRAGIVNWNTQTTGAAGALPFGGPGLSGNHRPAGYYAADYCAWPMASLTKAGTLTDEAEMIGVLA